jgi:hypothetical protein
VWFFTCRLDWLCVVFGFMSFGSASAIRIGVVSYLFELAFVCLSDSTLLFFPQLMSCPLDWLRAALGLNLCCN